MLQDRNGVIWIATKGDGIIRVEKATGPSNSYKLTRYKYNADDIYIKMGASKALMEIDELLGI